MRVIKHLTKKNYYGNTGHWSASLCKEFNNCPARAIAELKGEYVRPKSEALMVGSYVDAWFDGPTAFEEFKANNPEIFNSRTGELKAPYKRADEMIEMVKRDKFFMEYCRGYKQTIRTGELFGFPFKCKMDFYRPGDRIVDLKTTADFQPKYAEGRGRVTFIDYWQWPLQMAIYQALEGNKLPTYLAIVSKQDPPDHAVVFIPQELLDAELEILKEKLPRWDAMRQGIIEPERCEDCDYCRATKKIKGIVSLEEMELSL